MKRRGPRPLGHSSSDWGGVGFERFELDEPSAAREIRVEPAKGGVSDSSGGGSTCVVGGDFLRKSTIESRPTRFLHYQLSKLITAQNFILVQGHDGHSGYSAILCSYFLRKCCPVLIKLPVLSPVSTQRKLIGLSIGILTENNSDGSF